MKLGQHWRRLAGLVVLTLGLGGTSGCLSCFHPVKEPALELVGPCKALPKDCRDHVYVFFIHGLDPFDCANLTGVRDYLHSMGFRKTYFGQLYHTPYFEKEICRLRQEEPEAEFVLVGFSLGANMVRSMAQHVKDQGIDIALLVYLGGNTLEDIPYDRPDNARRIVNILASGCIWNGAWLEGAENLHLTDVYHFGSPTHPQTLELLAREMTEVAAAVPIITEDPAEALPVSEEDAPTPRPVVPRAAAAAHDEWDFLKPAPRRAMASRSAPARQPSAEPAQGENVAGK
jgi:hypothetical protein